MCGKVTRTRRLPLSLGRPRAIIVLAQNGKSRCCTYLPQLTSAQERRRRRLSRHNLGVSVDVGLLGSEAAAQHDEAPSSTTAIITITTAPDSNTEEPVHLALPKLSVGKVSIDGSVIDDERMSSSQADFVPEVLVYTSSPTTGSPTHDDKRLETLEYNCSPNAQYDGRRSGEICATGGVTRGETTADVLELSISSEFDEIYRLIESEMLPLRPPLPEMHAFATTIFPDDDDEEGGTQLEQLDMPERPVHFLGQVVSDEDDTPLEPPRKSLADIVDAKLQRMRQSDQEEAVLLEEGRSSLEALVLRKGLRAASSEPDDVVVQHTPVPDAASHSGTLSVPAECASDSTAVAALGTDAATDSALGVHADVDVSASVSESLGTPTLLEPQQAQSEALEEPARKNSLDDQMSASIPASTAVAAQAPKPAHTMSRRSSSLSGLAQTAVTVDTTRRRSSARKTDDIYEKRTVSFVAVAEEPGEAARRGSDNASPSGPHSDVMHAWVTDALQAIPCIGNTRTSVPRQVI